MNYKSILYNSCLVIGDITGYISYIYNNELPTDFKENESPIMMNPRNYSSINSSAGSQLTFDMTFGSN